MLETMRAEAPRNGSPGSSWAGLSMEATGFEVAAGERVGAGGGVGSTTAGTGVGAAVGGEGMGAAAARGSGVVAHTAGCWG